MRVSFLPEVESEHLKQVAYYEAQQIGLGTRYLAEVSAASSIFAMLSLGLGACASTYTRQTATAPTSKLVTTSDVLVAVPHDGSYGDDSYPGSGTATADAVRAAFSRYSSNVQVASGCSDIACLRSSPEHFVYYVVPQILHWEDRATEWSGKKDKIEIKISVYGTDTTPIASQIISGKSKWLTFGGDHPQDLLPEPINAYVASLYQ